MSRRKKFIRKNSGLSNPKLINFLYLIAALEPLKGYFPISSKKTDAGIYNQEIFLISVLT